MGTYCIVMRIIIDKKCSIFPYRIREWEMIALRFIGGALPFVKSLIIEKLMMSYLSH